MKKVIQLVDHLPRIFENAVDLSEAGKYEQSLSLLARARSLTEPESPDYVAVELERAEIYTAMGLYGNAIKIYLKLFRFDCDMEEVILGLVRAFTLSDMLTQAAYYLNLGVELGILESDGAMEALDISEQQFQPKIRLLKKDNSYLLSVAKQLLQSGDTDYSAQILEGIKEDSPQFKEASSCLAYIKLTGGDVKSADRYIDRVLAIEPENIAALCEKCLACIIGGETEKAYLLSERIYALCGDSPEDMSRAVMTFARLGDNQKCFEFAQKLLALRPYERNMLLLSAIAAGNLGESAAAKEFIVKARTIYPDDYVLSYYARLIHAGEKNIPVAVDIPFAVQEKLYERLEQLLIETGSADSAVKKLERGGEFKELVFMALGGDNIAMQAKVGGFLAQSKLFHDEILDLLIDPDFQLMAKKETLLEFLKFADDKSFALVINNLLQVFTPKTPLPHAGVKAENAYWTVYGTLAFVDIGFDKKLSAAYKSLAPLAAVFPEIPENVLSACIAYKSGANRIFFNKSSCCEVFNCEEKDFNTYYDYFLLSSKKASAKKKKEGVQS